MLPGFCFAQVFHVEHSVEKDMMGWNIFRCVP